MSLHSIARRNPAALAAPVEYSPAASLCRRPAQYAAHGPQQPARQGASVRLSWRILDTPQDASGRYQELFELQLPEDGPLPCWDRTGDVLEEDLSFEDMLLGLTH